MNGSENGYAGAFFFALMSFGALLKLDDFLGWIVGVICAVLATMSLRFALIKSAQAVEEDHQRIEIQLQQLRSKISEVAVVNATAMSSVNGAAQIVQENLEVIRVRLAELDNLTQIAENLNQLNPVPINENLELEKKIDNLTQIAENLNRLNTTPTNENLELEKKIDNLTQIAENLNQLNTTPTNENSELEKKIDNLTQIAEDLHQLNTTPTNENLELEKKLDQLNEIEAANKASLQTILKLLQVVAQLIKNKSYARDLEKINSSLVLLAEKIK